jgi:4a-hydroxytetrahydrobiopterin dehydratase
MVAVAVVAVSLLVLGLLLAPPVDGIVLRHFKSYPDRAGTRGGRASLGVVAACVVLGGIHAAVGRVKRMVRWPTPGVMIHLLLVSTAGSALIVVGSTFVFLLVHAIVLANVQATMSHGPVISGTGLLLGFGLAMLAANRLNALLRAFDREGPAMGVAVKPVDPVDLGRGESHPQGPTRSPSMSTTTADQLSRKKCVPCEGGVPALSAQEAKDLAAGVEGWAISPDGKVIRREWTARNFVAAMEFLNRVAELAEEDGHHPDFHLVGYRNVAIELTTHAIGGLSENDFILAAKINQVPVATKG